MSFVDEYLRVAFADCSQLEHIASFNKWAHWQQMAAYGCGLDPGDISQRDNANDYSPEGPDE